MLGFPGGASGKEPTCQCRRQTHIRSLGQEDPLKEGNPLQYSCLENPIDRGALWATVHRFTKSWTLLKQLSTRCTCKHIRLGYICMVKISVFLFFLLLSLVCVYKGDYCYWITSLEKKSSNVFCKIFIVSGSAAILVWTLYLLCKIHIHSCLENCSDSTEESQGALVLTIYIVNRKISCIFILI